MEMKLPLRGRSLTAGQWLAVGLVGLIVIAGLIRLRNVGHSYPIVSADYQPFSSEAESCQFYLQHPLMKKQAPERARFTFKASVGPDKQAVYQLGLFAPAMKPNNSGSTQRYIAGLQLSQAEAKAWIKAQGEDLEKAYIIWSPDPASFVAGAKTTTPPLPQKTQTSAPKEPRFPH